MTISVNSTAPRSAEPSPIVPWSRFQGLPRLTTPRGTGATPQADYPPVQGVVNQLLSQAVTASLEAANRTQDVGGAITFP
jgi:hypothetical protein